MGGAGPEGGPWAHAGEDTLASTLDRCPFSPAVNFFSQRAALITLACRCLCLPSSPCHLLTAPKPKPPSPPPSSRVNYEDPNYNVALPVLTIHGNHDDPAGAENLSAVDILSTCRLLNYFGKVGSGLWREGSAACLCPKLTPSSP